MHLMGCQNIMALAGSRKLFQNITLGIEDGDKIGILGPNGGGKSTLLKILAKKKKPDDGTVTIANSTTISILEQIDKIDDNLTVSQVVHGEKADEKSHEWLADPQIRRIHEGLLKDIDLQSQLSTLSGGQKRRVALAKVLSQKSDVLFLDEPTNHLDIIGITWLAEYLNNKFADKKGALVVVTHDRWFLDAVCTKIWEVVPGMDAGNGDDILPGSMEFYEGSYAAYILARVERERQRQVENQKRNSLLKKELAWLRRGAPARTSKPRFRIDRAQALIDDVPPLRNKVELAKLTTARLGKDVVDIENVTIRFGRNEPVLDNITWRLSAGDRIGIVGANGVGKSTLMHLIEGVLKPEIGRVKFGKTVKIGVLSQDTHELDEVAHLRVVEAVSIISNSIVVDGKEISASQFVQKLGFTKSRAWTRISELSGGERRRLQFMRILMREPNVLLLDEPTNDLDTDTLASMEDILDTFPTTLIVVSHDRYLLERVSDYQMLVDQGKITMLTKGVDEYLEKLESIKNCSDKKSVSDNSKENYSSRQIVSENKNVHENDDNSGARKLSGAQIHQYNKELSSLERKIEKIQTCIALLNEKLSALSASCEKLDEIIQIDKELKEKQAECESLENRWFEISELIQ